METLPEMEEVFFCPICMKRCEGRDAYIAHYYEYCPKTRKYIGRVVEITTDYYRDEDSISTERCYDTILDDIHDIPNDPENYAVDEEY